MNKLIIIALALSLAACGHSKKKTSDHKSNIDLTAAGATFPLPYYNLAFKTYKDSTGGEDQVQRPGRHFSEQKPCKNAAGRTADEIRKRVRNRQAVMQRIDHDRNDA